MTEIEKRDAARAFVTDWQDKGYEKGHSQPFWLVLLRDVYGVARPEQQISFEDQVMLDHTSFIDGYIPETHVLIEQKGNDRDLRKAIRQSDGSYLTPFQQAKRYSANLPYSRRPRWIVTCNFKAFLVYDMENPNGEPEEILLANLHEETYRLEFLVDAQNEAIIREMEISIKAGEIVGKFYDALLKQYRDPENPESLKSLNMLCVRLVFCLYAEDAGIFGKHGIFKDYLKRYLNPADVRKALIELFAVLNQTVAERDPYMEPALGAFPYVNGGLFATEKIEIPGFSQEIVDLLIHDASEDFDWQEISPTIFGAVFESTLNPETRRSGGMHYTSIENIHKVIDPLFLDDLKDEFDQLKEEPVEKTRNRNLSTFQEKLAGLNFLDPACGSGNFLTESYLALRQLENDVLKVLLGDQIRIGSDLHSPIKVSIHQFYGIEINDFAVSVGKTALWIAEAQMMKKTEDIVHMHLDFLPLKSYANIIEGNALQIAWETVVPPTELDFVMGNPPFVGYSLQSKAQKNDLLAVYVDEAGKPYKSAGKIDFVAGWYFKAAQLMDGTGIRTAFVSTNSITQGEQVAGVFKPLYECFGIHFDFAYRTFKWASEASDQAAVHCVIVGFSQAPNPADKRIYSGEAISNKVEQINSYLVEAPVVFIENIKKPLCDVPEMTTGNRPADGGHLLIFADDYESFIKKEPKAKKFIKKFVGAAEFINNKKRWCLWLVDASPAEIRSMPLVKERVERCRLDRLNAPDVGRQKLAEKPAFFREIKNPKSYVLVPSTSSENRRYIPIGFLDDTSIPSNSTIILPDATLYHFGILTSNVHMAWMRVVAGRLKSDYRYSINIVYNNFPWPSPTVAQQALIEKTAQAILDARALYPDCSLADLYDEITMPKELRRAHQANDKAVLAAYGFDKNIRESQCVAELMRLNQALTEK
ncbi:DNA methyltransferase [Acetobacterium sp. K1/6]|uniref:DNA methyltransferase n=1 Tax=Acetobacterium sp. K1/6 TaxID=3055467 RepID=UPI002ACA435E|nr:DNA methyltransferase [Acetobacterium sp. K1/6]MDZ5726714.1 DNA methyltransferase [Acetobacterium sp. K1/6]